MSKSLGNFVTIRDALNSYHPEVLRLFLLSKHYRSPLDFSKSAVKDLQSGLGRIYRLIQRLETCIGTYQEDNNVFDSGFLSDTHKDPFLEQFINMMDDDLNTAGATGLVFEKVKDINRFLDEHENLADEKMIDQLKDDRRHLFMAARVLGLLNEDPETFFTKLSDSAENIDTHDVERLIEERAKARANKDWKQADAVRDQLKEMGVVLEDGPEGTTWRFDV